MSGISTHVLDLASGLPAPAIPVRLELLDAGAWHLLCVQDTDADGRCKQLLPVSAVTADTYRLIFSIANYQRGRDYSTGTPLYPEIIITFEIAEPESSYHMPVLLSPNGYTTYRGS